ncbi:MAG: response regulator [Myxococcales bacterium]
MRSSASAPNQPQSAPARILAVDDLPSNLVALGAALEPLGIDLVTATSGAQAVELASTQQFAAILLDYMMPDLDGLGTLQLLVQKRVTTPVVLITALSPETSLLAKAYELGAIDFLEKPISPMILRGKVSALIKLHDNQVQQRKSEYERSVAERQRGVWFDALVAPLEYVRKELARAQLTGAADAALLTSFVDQIDLAMADLARANRGDAEPLALTRQEVDVAQLCEALVARHCALHGEHSVELASSASVVSGDPARLLQALTLLFSVAQKRCETFTVLVQSGDGKVVMTVTDRGPQNPAA